MWRISILLLCFIALCFASEEASLIISKQILSPEIVVGQEVPVTIRIFNVGGSSAYDVRLTDNNWSEDLFTRTIGLDSASWDRIPAGENVTHSFVVTAKHLGLFSSGPARVEYRQRTDSAAQVGYSTSEENIEIVKFSLLNMEKSSHLREWGIFSLLTLIPIVLPLIRWYFYRRNYTNGIANNSDLANAVAIKKKKKKNQ